MVVVRRLRARALHETICLCGRQPRSVLLLRANENGGGPAAKRRRRGRDGDARDVKQKTLFDAFRVGDG